MDFTFRLLSDDFQKLILKCDKFCNLFLNIIHKYSKVIISI